MKNFLLLLLYSILCTISAEAQTPTYANLPGPENVLVVYKQPVDENDTLGLVSEAVKDYYKNARGIPAENVVPLNLPDSIEITIDNVTHWVGLAQETDIIQDYYQNAVKAVWPKFHAWRYYLDYVAAPIKDWITSHNLTSTIRYIVLCKGVPFKIQARGDWAGSGYNANGNLTVDGLLSMLNTNNYYNFIENYVYPVGYINNPYSFKDPNLTMDYRFIPDYFTTANFNLSYLISRLDGVNYETVKGMIDRSIAADKSGNGTWILDDDPIYPDWQSFHDLFTNA